MQETPNQQIRPNIAGNTNTGMLKLLALICMVTDHVGAVFFPGMTELRIIGRIAFPLYIWCAVVGVEYTRDHRNYALRLLLFALISQPFYMLGLNHSLQELNVMFTILCGVLGLIGIRERRYGSHIWGPVLAVLLGCIFKMDYGWRGILLMLVLYAARRQRGAMAMAFLAFCLYWGSDSSAVRDLFGLPIPATIPLLSYGGLLLRAVFKLQFMAFLALPFMLYDNKGNCTRLPKWLGYAAYPGHLAIIALLRYLIIA